MLHFVLAFLALPLMAQLQIGPFPHTNGLTEAFRSAEHLQFERKDRVILKGAAFGPKRGDPIIAVPGYFSSSAYYGDSATILAANGIRTYTYSLGGQGQGVLRSDYRKPRQEYAGQFGFERHVLDLIEMIDAVYELHQKPVVVIGHSLGGLIIRAAMTGVDVSGDTHKISPALRKRIRERVKKFIIYKSPSPAITKAADFGIELSMNEQWKLLKGKFIILSIIPKLAAVTDSSLVQSLQKGASFIPFIDLITTLGLKVSDFIMSDVVSASDFRGSRVNESFRTASSFRLRKDIVKDLARFINSGFLTSRGFDLAEAYLDKSTVHLRAPAIIVSGTRDILGLEKFNRIEAEHLGYRHLINGNTHMTGFFGISAATTAEIVLEAVDPNRTWDLSSACQYVF